MRNSTKRSNEIKFYCFHTSLISIWTFAVELYTVGLIYRKEELFNIYTDHKISQKIYYKFNTLSYNKWIFSLERLVLK